MNYNREEAIEIKGKLDASNNELEKIISQASLCNSSLDSCHAITKKFFQNDVDLVIEPRNWMNSLADIINNLKLGINKMDNEDRTFGEQISTLQTSIALKLDKLKTKQVSEARKDSDVNSSEIETLEANGNYEVTKEGSDVNSSEIETLKVGIVQTQNTGLNLRTSPDSSSKENIIGSLPKGTEVNIIGESADGKWYKIFYNDKELFVFKKYVEGVQNE